VEILCLILITLAIVLGALILAVGVYLALPLPFPSVTESDYSHHRTPWWQLYYSHKYLRPKRRAARGSGLEGYFDGLDFHFEPPPLRDAGTISIGATGDLMCRKDLAGQGSRYLFDDIGHHLFSSDITIGNLEFAVNEKTYFHKLLRFSVPPHYAEPLLGDERFGRFDVVSLANNHVNDSFHEGITETCRFLDRIGIPHVGANRTKAEQDDIVIVEREGIKIAVLAYSFSTNGISLDAGRDFGLNLVRFNAVDERDYSPELILKHIDIAKAKGADYIISCHHWGIDLELYPPPRIVRRAHDLLEAGIDLIIGHHPHVLGQVDRHKTADGRDGLVFYSLGNLTAKGLLFPIQRLSAVVKIVLTTGTDSTGKRVVAPSRIEMTPTLFTTRRHKGARRGHIRPVKQSIEQLGAGASPLGFSFREQLELKRADALFQSYFENDGNGIVFR
jgi:hypothetical protein